MDFKVGDRVRVKIRDNDAQTGTVFWRSREGKIGTIIGINEENCMIAFDDPNEGTDQGHYSRLELVTHNKSLIEKTMSFIKKLLNPDDALVEKHFTKDGALDLSDADVQAAIYKLVKTDLVTAAQAKEAAEKK